MELNALTTVFEMPVLCFKYVGYVQSSWVKSLGVAMQVSLGGM